MKFQTRNTAYVVQVRPARTEDQLVLENGTVVIFSCDDWTTARISVAGIEDADIVYRHQLSDRDRARIDRALNKTKCGSCR